MSTSASALDIMGVPYNRLMLGRNQQQRMSIAAELERETGTSVSESNVLVTMLAGLVLNDSSNISSTTWYSAHIRERPF